MKKISLYDIVLNGNHSTLYAKENFDGLNKYSTYEDMVKFMNKALNLNRCAREYNYVFAFNNNLNPLGVYEVSSGSNMQSMICIREIFMFLLMVGAEQFVMFHNHPCGLTEPSDQDYNVTNIVTKASMLMGITFCDHIIISRNKWKIIGKNYNGAKGINIPQVSLDGIINPNPVIPQVSMEGII